MEEVEGRVAGRWIFLGWGVCSEGTRELVWRELGGMTRVM